MAGYIGKDSSGVLLAETDPNAVPKTGGSFTGAITVDETSASPLTLDRNSTDGSIVTLQKDGTTVGSIKTEGGRLSITDDTYGGITFLAGSHCVAPANNAGARYDNAVDLGSSTYRFKNLYLSGGVYLGGTGSANYLDDYEEGTFTAYFSDASSGGNNAAITYYRGKYTKIGRQVTININMYNINTSGLTSGNNIYITNLPFVCEDSTYVGSVYTNLFNGGGTDMYFSTDVPANTSYAQIFSCQSDGGATAILTVAAVTSSNADLGLTITYFTT